MRNQSIRHRIVPQRRLILALRNHDICHKPLDRMLNVEASVHTLLCLPHAFDPGPMGSKWIQVITMAPWLVLIALDAAPYIFHIFPCTSGKKNSTELGLVHVSFLFTTLPPPLKTIPNWSLLQVPSTNLTYKNQWQPIIYRSFPRETLKPWVFCKKTHDLPAVLHHKEISGSCSSLSSWLSWLIIRRSGTLQASQLWNHRDTGIIILAIGFNRSAICR